jgi:hypothetical protein
MLTNTIAPLLFCNIAWMKHYNGRDENDPPLGGGGFPRENGYCGEECNFLECPDGFVYGYFRTGDRQIKIERLGANKTDPWIDGVELVWTAPIEGNEPRVVVGWFQNARVYRHRQSFNGEYPSDRHLSDEIPYFQVKARAADAVLLRPPARKLELSRGKGWSGETSWWFAADTEDADAQAFVAQVRAVIAGTSPGSAGTARKRPSGGGGRAGSAATRASRRYLKTYEIVVSPRHHELENRFKSWLRKQHTSLEWLKTWRDDLRYLPASDDQPVMVEVKPSEPVDVRYAIRAAIGQLCDYRQHQQWTGRQLIVVGAPVERDDDLRLALDNGFGLAWPADRGFKIVWP